MVTRRRVVIALGAGTLMPLASFAQQQPSKMLRVGRLSPVSSSTDAPSFDSLRQGLRDLGCVEGKNIAMEYRFADGKLDRLPELAAELVRLKVDVIVAGSTQGALAANSAYPHDPYRDGNNRRSGRERARR